MARRAGQTAQRIAVVDIGSNSVRLVVYDTMGGAMLPYYNEKVMAGLGRGIGETGRLPKDGVELALRALRRFRAILDGLNVRTVRAVATAAVRTAKDGPDFAARVSREAGFEVEVISGEDEARYSARGLAAGLHQPAGLMGDLGGASLEFAVISPGGAEQFETHLAGPLMFGDPYHRKTRLKEIRARLATSGALASSGGRFYAVGGAWRALAKLHMELTDYRLQHLHGYQMRPGDVIEAAAGAHAKDAKSMALLKRAGGRRAGVLPHAATLLDVIMEAGDFSEVVISSFGVREGIVRILAGNGEDMLFEGIHMVARLSPPQQAFGRALHDFVAPAVNHDPSLFGQAQADDQRVDRAACLLADLGARFHPDHRAQLAYDTIIRAPFAGVTHRERAFLALAVGARYSRRLQTPPAYSPLLSGQEAARARRLGACMRLGAVFSGRSAKMLQSASLRPDGGRLVLSVPQKSVAMVSETVERRLGLAARLMDLEPIVDIRSGAKRDG